jgi:hypothetical protein
VGCGEMVWRFSHKNNHNNNNNNNTIRKTKVKGRENQHITSLTMMIEEGIVKEGKHFWKNRSFLEIRTE